MKEVLLIFIKNPELGKAKTRIAKEVGDEKALSIYLELLEHTRNISRKLNADKWVCYSSFIDQEDEWRPPFQKHLQGSGDLGQKMLQAFKEALSLYNKALIIGSDCADISTTIIEQAFEALNEVDVVIGPAEDGGYYLLGMKQLIPNLFEHKHWSTESVFADTMKDIERLALSHHLLPILSDIDYYEDYLARMRPKT